MNPPQTQGFIALDKSDGQTSARAVAAVKRLLRGPGERPPKPPKVGHAGTLDPFATGVLVVLVGPATKQCERVMGLPKGYDATVRLGAITATLDPETPEQAYVPPSGESRADVPTAAEIAAALAGMTGEVSQVPPVFSALKIGGRRSADRARAGEAVRAKPRVVRIDRLEVLDYDWPTVRIRVACGRGTYVRAIARDLGAALGVGGYLTELRRNFVGPFTERRSVTLERLEVEGVEAHLIDPESVDLSQGAAPP